MDTLDRNSASDLARASALLVLNSSDNVAVVVKKEGVPSGAILLNSIKAKEAIPCAHKVAIQDIPAGEGIYKFGHKIAVAIVPIKAGEWVHCHNAKMPESESADFVFSQSATIEDGYSISRCFQGYRRTTGTVGIRNFIAVVGTVNCSATVVKAICRHFAGSEAVAILKQKNIDGVVPVTHGSGCAQAIAGDNYAILNRTLAGTAFHPNVVGALFVELGCEGTTSQSILECAERLQLNREFEPQTIGIQSSGGSLDAINEGIKKVFKVISSLPSFSRSDVPVSELKIALNCGGSDAFSAITANPLLGMVSDLIVQRGGTVVLAEIPECHGVESLLKARAKSSDVSRKLEDVFKWWREYAAMNDCELNNNLSPGNIAGGITTIIEKSVGAVEKAGTGILADVVGYAMPIQTPGFVLMNTPGFDPVSVTGLVAGGCNLVAFTTGRGSVFGSATAPTVKIATNTPLFERMRGDMDFDAGRIASGGQWRQEALRLYEFIIETASGRQTASEKLGMGWEEFVVWSVGETL